MLAPGHPAVGSSYPQGRVSKRPPEETAAVQTSNPTNAEIADRLSLFAALLEIAGTNTFAVRAYGGRPPDPCDAGLRGGARSQPVASASSAASARASRCRSRELIETGEIAELRSLEAEVHPALVGVRPAHSGSLRSAHSASPATWASPPSTNSSGQSRKVGYRKRPASAPQRRRRSQPPAGRSRTRSAA